jgi:hypothetical protein
MDIFSSMESVRESLQKFSRIQLCASLYLIKEATAESGGGKARGGIVTIDVHMFSKLLRTGFWADTHN